MRRIFKIALLTISICILLAASRSLSIKVNNLYSSPIIIKVSNNNVGINENYFYKIYDSLYFNDSLHITKDKMHFFEDSIQRATINIIINRNPENLFINEQLTYLSFLINPNKLSVIETNFVNVGNESFALKHFQILDSNQNLIEILRGTFHLFDREKCVNFPFNENSFKTDANYFNFLKNVKYDSLCIKYYDTQVLYAKKEYNKVLKQVNVYNYNLTPNVYKDNKQNRIYTTTIKKNQIVGMLTLGILSSYKINQINLTKEYWHKLKNLYPIEAYYLSLYDPEIKYYNLQ